MHKDFGSNLRDIRFQPRDANAAEPGFGFALTAGLQVPLQAPNPSSSLLWPMKRAQFVPVGIPHVRYVQGVRAGSPRAWRLLDRSAAMRYRSVVELLHLLGRRALEPDGPAVGKSRRLV